MSHLATFAEAGFAIVENVLDDADCDRLLEELAPWQGDGRAGRRGVLDEAPVRRTVAAPRVRELVGSALGAGAFAVRALLFDKTPQANSSLDRRERTVQTDDRGRFSVELDRAGLYAAVATKGEALHSPVVSPVVAGDVLMLVAHQAHRWSGRVFDTSNGGKPEPVVGADVLVMVEAKRRSTFAFGSSPMLWIEF